MAGGLALSTGLYAAAQPAASTAAASGMVQPSAVRRQVPFQLPGTALLDGFEEAFWPDPSLWRLPADTTPMWWPSTCQAHSGRRALWAFGGPTLEGERRCDASAPPGTSNVIVMNLDLREARLASRLDLYFALWLAMPPGEDQGLFLHLLVPRPTGGYERVPVFGATATSGRWSFPLRRLDLLALADIDAPDRVYDLRGGFWRLEWTAVALRGTPPGGGIFIDDLTLVWEPDAAVPAPTVRVLPTTTPPPSPTNRPTGTATWTASPPPPPATYEPWPVCLPLVVRSYPDPTATPTVEGSPTPETAVATSSAPAPPTATPPPLPTVEPS